MIPDGHPEAGDPQGIFGIFNLSDWELKKKKRQIKKDENKIKNDFFII